MARDGSFPRGSGILLHITSLPGKYGIGDMGEAAYSFVDYLARSWQNYWQVLPLNPTGFADSPYQCLSSFAGNTTLISLDQLVTTGWLTAAELDDHPPFRERCVDYQIVHQWHNEMLSLAFERFAAAGGEDDFNFKGFCHENKHWLDDYCFFSSLKENHDLKSWVDWEKELSPVEKAAVFSLMNENPNVNGWHWWEKPLASANEVAINTEREKLHYRIREYRFRQWKFESQWLELRAYANSKDIKIIGDIPMYAAHDSADVWANRSLFELEEDGRVKLQAGVPPDYFSTTGQLWGNPIYRWDEHRKTGYEWWLKRIDRALVLYDMVRIDHFRGFWSYWEIPGEEKTAIKGRWVDGPRDDFFDALQEHMGGHLSGSIIAEDLGDEMQPVIEWRQRLGLLGMKILQFAFGGNPEESHFLPIKFVSIEDDCIMYTGTHDNSTIMGWWQYETNELQREQVIALCHKWHRDTKPLFAEPHWEMITIGMQSNSPIFIAPMQDILGSGKSSRMNMPGQVGGYWRWRCTWAELEGADWGRLAILTRNAHRR